MRLKVYPGERPKTRGECADMPRPCPFVSCKWHLAHVRMERRLPGKSKSMYRERDFTDDEIVEWIEGAEETCALDVADQGGRKHRDVERLSGSQGNLVYQRSLDRIDDEPIRELLRAAEAARRGDVNLFADSE